MDKKAEATQWLVQLAAAVTFDAIRKCSHPEYCSACKWDRVDVLCASDYLEAGDLEGAARAALRVLMPIANG